MSKSRRETEREKAGKKSLVFIHPDLGIGGAERLVVDAAVGCQNLGYKVTIFTSHCDPKHSFDEVRQLDVRVRGDSIVPPSILGGRFTILCAILRQLHLILQIALFTNELASIQPDAFFIDQLSACIPLLKWLLPQPKATILFYCHFPDQLLVQRKSIIKRLYRAPFDWLESWSTGCSDTIVVNSYFTKSVFKQVFRKLKDRDPQVVYPCVDINAYAPDLEVAGLLTKQWKDKKVLLSINRFERKKGVDLAIRAYSQLPKALRKTSRLVIAGGYDPRVAENVEHHHELLTLSEDLGLSCSTETTVRGAITTDEDVNVLFLLSVPGDFKWVLLKVARLLVYTPKEEHFGIVPIEAMLARTPVLAANSGGPMETVEDGGWLKNPEDVDEWAKVMFGVLTKEASWINAIGEKGRKRTEMFSRDKMADALAKYL
ncbi:UDP-Glycosyltransferase/glycogen phosphorylase [Eremomyces bilateralis CBS 781.70]|uniref:Alpha-1,3/1,6-mannosyltransferase ALG2 n=1 Tax=Eremomyces bilateralis CBS 781.70 TaxID=1392243 RepID=A0A6G1GHQ6_9PEZI|nr:UDP-Glycosyltransferase/glycogen phosphorylase [Eremomyces bilateralis CBS 781.70]KAF1817400.1 UDP-Glycosyltransferase/glycogen phosphorylase [Eremomyces bilateralis CBS 781.70]